MVADPVRQHRRAAIHSPRRATAGTPTGETTWLSQPQCNVPTGSKSTIPASAGARILCPLRTHDLAAGNEWIAIPLLTSSTHSPPREHPRRVRNCCHAPVADGACQAALFLRNQAEFVICDKGELHDVNRHGPPIHNVADKSLRLHPSATSLTCRPPLLSPQSRPPTELPPHPP